MDWSNLKSPALEPVPLIDLTEQYQNLKHEIDPVVAEVFRTQHFIMGDKVAQFEANFERYCDAEYAIGCASGSDALVLALKALGIGPGDEVITTPFSFFATASCIERVGAKTVFADIDPVTYNIDPAAVESLITDQTRAIIPVHLFGQCCDMDNLWRIATKYDLEIIEDSAQSIGSEYQGRRSGVLGSIACFSFFPTKNLGGAGDGGMLTTDKKEVADRLKRLRVHGDVGRYNHVEVGFNSRLDALQAAVLDVKLRHLDQWNHRRLENALTYQSFWENNQMLDYLVPPTITAGNRHVFNQYCVRVPNGQREHVQKTLKAKDVGCAVYYPQPLHLQTCFKYLGYQKGQFPVSEQLSEEILALPIYPELKVDHLERVVEAVCLAAETSARSTIPMFPAKTRKVA
jgi:dTDP-4-amino-4,6-dideoxygalactose transaminase